MGDIVEFTTVANLPYHIFYKITSGSLRFQVRGTGDAGISLAKRPCRTCTFWIIMKQQGSTVLLKGAKQIYSVRTPRSLQQYREYCMQWYDNVITLGLGDSDEPFAVFKEDTIGLNFITFASFGQNMDYLRWTFEMPPVLEKEVIKAISSGALEWKSVDDQSVPDGAFIGGYENGEVLYIIRAEHNGSLVPGKFVRSEGIAYIPWERSLLEKTKFEILCGYNCVWVPCCDGKVPTGAVEGGYSADDGQVIYVGRALYQDNLIPGRLHASRSYCFLAIDDHYQNVMVDYEILVDPEKNMHCANPLFMDNMRLQETAKEDPYIEDSDGSGSED